jgi:hypothetical protein
MLRNGIEASPGVDRMFLMEAGLLTEVEVVGNNTREEEAVGNNTREVEAVGNNTREVEAVGNNTREVEAVGVITPEVKALVGQDGKISAAISYGAGATARGSRLALAQPASSSSSSSSSSSASFSSSSSSSSSTSAFSSSSSSASSSPHSSVSSSSTTTTTTSSLSSSSTSSSSVATATSSSTFSASYSPSAGPRVAASGALTVRENRERGVVRLMVLRSYLSAVGLPALFFICCGMISMQASRNAADWWMAVWVAALSPAGNASQGEGGEGSNSLFANHSSAFFLEVFGFIGLGNTLFTLFRSFIFAWGGLRAAQSIYKNLMNRVVEAGFSFFDANPVGRILNRFRQSFLLPSKCCFHVATIPTNTHFKIVI